MKTNKNKKIVNWINQQYQLYDIIDRCYTGDRYTKQIFKTASQKFNLTEQELINIYANTKYDVKSKSSNVSFNIQELKKLKDMVDYTLDKKPTTKFNNKTVKIKTKQILQNNTNELNPKFIDFLKQHQDTVFIAITNHQSPHLYELRYKDSNINSNSNYNIFWLFNEKDLELIN